ncbi:hypothetical protein [Aquimarina algicola]|uniref:Uncharacterized protein n=1 Tax=Aquimarina algicola TaxID=2589995 RepID=A0A504IZA6_9FLAO|nr:hypothetical protein [Aquimarina algicola]TPN83866.1 hypothetical protein FHK87_18030 [Aquimarina algicola]
MPIKRNRNQDDQTLIEFYTEKTKTPYGFTKGAATLMLHWIERINEELKETKIWADTANLHLNLQNVDDFSENFVTIATSTDEYHIDYKVPSESEPWENARTRGSTKSLDDAMKMLKKAMIYSKGWIESSELKTY